MGLPLIDNLFKKGADAVIGTLGKAIDRVFTNDEERLAKQAELEKIKNEAFAEVNRHFEAIQSDATKQLDLILADKQSAREMYKHNSSLQKIFALCFLGMYLILSTLMLCKILGFLGANVPKIDEFGTIWISTLWGGMTAKLNTITDFLFGAGLEKKA